MEFFRTFTTPGALWASVVRESVPGFLRLSEWQPGLLLFSTHSELMIQYFHCLLPDSSREEGRVDIQLSQNSCWKFHLVKPLLEDALNKSLWRRSILPAPLFPFVAFSGTSFDSHLFCPLIFHFKYLLRPRERVLVIYWWFSNQLGEPSNPKSLDSRLHHTLPPLMPAWKFVTAEQVVWLGQLWYKRPFQSDRTEIAHMVKWPLGSLTVISESASFPFLSYSCSSGPFSS